MANSFLVEGWLFFLAHHIKKDFAKKEVKSRKITTAGKGTAGYFVKTT